jgi:tetratricopeptide (TPR) repeat protein
MIILFRNCVSSLSRAIANHGLQILLLMVLTWLTYSEILTHSFLVSWDDPGYITQNPAVLGFSWRNLFIAFTTTVAGNYAPVPIISYMLDYTIWGMNPTGFLLANVTYHSLSGVLLYFLLVRLGYGRWASLFGCALFLVHPVQMESVAWMSQRKNLLAMFFYLLAFHAWLRHREQKAGNGLKWYAASVVFFTISLFSKSVAVIFPLMLILHDVLMGTGRNRLRGHIDKLPFLTAACLVGIIALITQSIESQGGRVAYPDHALWVVPITMLPVLLSYLRMIVWPDPYALSAIYTVPTRHTIDVIVILAAVIIVFLGIIGIYLYRESRPALFWYLLFFLGLLPVSQVIPLVTRMNDRYLYFPLLGVAGVVACLGTRVIGQSMQKILACAAFCVVVALSVACHIRGRVWKDTITLFSDMVVKVPDQYITWDGLAEGYRAAGDMETALRYYEMASKYGYLREIESYHLAHIYLERGDYDKAYKHIWGLLLKNATSGGREGFLLLGEYYYLTGAYADAEKQLLSYIAAVPDSAEACFILGKVYFMKGDRASARRMLYEAKQTGGESAKLLHALDCLESTTGCDSLEMHSGTIQEN